MLKDTYRRVADRARIKSNPLGSVLRDYVAYLGSRGHHPRTIQQYVNAVEHFGRWIKGRPIDHDTVERFIQRHLPHCRCTRPSTRRVMCVRAALRRLLGMLEVERSPTPEVEAICGLLDEYEDHLRHTCGLAQSTIASRRRYARELMQALGASHALDLKTWAPAQISDYVAKCGRTRKPSSGKDRASSIRSFLRLLLLRDIITRDLAVAVPSFAHWRLASLPKTLDQDELERLVATVDCTRGIGMRDRVVLLCMTDLGLRAGEVTSLTTDDVDLKARILRLHRSKLREYVEAPMTRRLVSAIRSYLRRGRPECESVAF